MLNNVSNWILSEWNYIDLEYFILLLNGISYCKLKKNFSSSIHSFYTLSFKHL